MTISNTLGVGFLEKVYENALSLELRKTGLMAEQQKSVPVYYDNQIVGDYNAEIIVNNCVIVELKVAKAIDDAHKAQLINYLKATRIKVGLILNFGTASLGIKRMIY